MLETESVLETGVYLNHVMWLSTLRKFYVIWFHGSFKDIHLAI